MHSANSKMEKRLSWIAPQDQRQADWLKAYIAQKGWCSHIPSNQWSSHYVASFLTEAKTWSENADTREQCRNLKAAWQSWDKRDKNKRTQKFYEGSYTISSAARNQLERLAKDGNCSFSGVIEELLLDAQEIKHLQKELARVLKEKDYGRSVNCNFLSTFFADDMLMAKAELVTQQLEKRNSYEKSTSKEKLGKARDTIKEKTAKLLQVNSKLKALQAENDMLKAENKKLQDLALEAQKELDQYLAE
ncbi:hypothetical protein [Vibrio alginolyticus]|uniref:hypothetical protein n=1 Tax=Vibrio alginolyticus TaxID=663 RepID=UPI001BD63CD2|nr:hypothetical protein [Vibrio alginolyticus]MBT0034984.1 hypothetical protein [Vibrio alginolyticus]HCH6462463.1 hypothetical protein [Vibrio parahaemolyticus]